jgi:hypothetical protein
MFRHGFPQQMASTVLAEKNLQSPAIRDYLRELVGKGQASGVPVDSPY